MQCYTSMICQNLSSICRQFQAKFYLVEQVLTGARHKHYRLDHNSGCLVNC